jgi:hypothetical protein
MSCIVKYGKHCTLLSMVAVVKQQLQLWNLHVWIQLSHDNGVVGMVNSIISSCSHLDWYKFCIHLRSLSVRHFGTVEATGLKSMSPKTPSLACLYRIS